MWRTICLILLLPTLSALVQPESKRRIETDAEAAARVATELSVLEASGNFNALYDRIHPDAHAVIPRAAAVGWFQNEFAPRGPGISTVTGVRFVEWTWNVTGQVYPYTAEVSYEQPFNDGSVDRDVVRLVLDHNNEWRWFFGRSREFVDEQIARYVPSVPMQTRSMSRVDVAVLDLETFWSGSFATTGQPYSTPVIQPFESAINTSCGTIAPSVGPAFYCPDDSAIYYSPSWFIGFEYEIGDFAWVTVMAHEWGHHVQALQGVPRLRGNEYELQADCLAGSYARDAETRGMLDQGDVAEAVTVSNVSGDPEWLPQDVDGAHGTSSDRISAFMRGFLDGFIGCGFLDEPEYAAGSTDDASSGDDRTMTNSGLTTFLPLQSDIPTGLELTEEATRTLGEITSNYSDPDEAERVFLSCGWAGNATRTFEGTGEPTGVTSIYTSVHSLASPRDAARLLDYSFENQRVSTGALAVEVFAGSGDTNRAMTTSTDATIYVQHDNVVIRLTVTGWSPDLLEMALSITSQILERAA